MLLELKFTREQQAKALREKLGMEKGGGATFFMFTRWGGEVKEERGVAVTLPEKVLMSGVRRHLGGRALAVFFERLKRWETF